jgi:hypothetical protein
MSSCKACGQTLDIRGKCVTCDSDTAVEAFTDMVLHYEQRIAELQSKIDRWIKAAKADGYPCDEPGCFQEVCQIARGNYGYVALPDLPNEVDSPRSAP